MKVIIAGGGTGGHLFPAVALGEELARRRRDVELLFVGSRAGFEAKWLPASGLNHRLFEMHGLTGHAVSERFRAVAEFFGALRKSMTLLSEFAPALVVSAGGYASAPLAVASILKRVPLVLMEQNARPGLANLLLWRFAAKVCVGFEDAAAFFDSTRVLVTGNPIRFVPRTSYPQSVDNRLDILVLGGSSGAHRLNLGILKAFKALDKTVIKFAVVHQTGDADVELVREEYRKIPLEARVVPFIDDMASALNRANLIVARAGAMTVSEIAAASRPAIYVPYPFHADRQQELNARVVEKLGGAMVVRDDDSLAENLQSAVEKLIANPAGLQEMGLRAYRAARPDAAARVATVCFEIAERKEKAA